MPSLADLDRILAKLRPNSAATAEETWQSWGSCATRRATTSSGLALADRGLGEANQALVLEGLDARRIPR